MYRLAVLCYCATWASGRRGRGSRVGRKRAEGETRVQLSSAEKAAVVEVFVQAAANMLAQSLNKLTVSCTIRQRNILNFFSVLPRRIEWRQEEEEEQGAGEDEDCDLPEADTQ